MVENLGVGDIFTGEVADAEAEEDELETSDEEDSDDEEGGPHRSRKHSSDSETEDGEDDEAAAPRWRPTPSRQTTLTQANLKQIEKDLPSLPPGAAAADGEKSRKRRKIPAPKAPELKVLPEMLPLFVEMVRPLLRPARSASATSFRSNSYDPYAAQQQQQQGSGRQGGADGVTRGMQDLGLSATASSPTSYVASPFGEQGGRQGSRSDRLPGEYKW